MSATIRIRTKVGDGKVFTLYFRNEWVTIMSGIGPSKSTAAKTLPEAADNHLAYCKILKEKQDVQRGRLASELLHGEGHPGNDPRGIPGGHDRTHREGPDGNGGEGWDSLLPPNGSSSQDEDTLQLEPQNTKLKEEKEHE